MANSTALLESTDQPSHCDIEVMEHSKQGNILKYVISLKASLMKDRHNLDMPRHMGYRPGSPVHCHTRRKQDVRS